jgi:hypothetical protein
MFQKSQLPAKADHLAVYLFFNNFFPWQNSVMGRWILTQKITWCDKPSTLSQALTKIHLERRKLPKCLFFPFFYSFLK